MTHKMITLEFIVPTVLAIVLGIVLSIGAVYLTNRYFESVDQSQSLQEGYSRQTLWLTDAELLRELRAKEK